jgi:hypothetical protein
MLEKRKRKGVAKEEAKACFDYATTGPGLPK